MALNHDRLRMGTKKRPVIFITGRFLGSAIGIRIKTDGMFRILATSKVETIVSDVFFTVTGVLPERQGFPCCDFQIQDQE